MAGKYLMGYDVGTTGSKGVIIDQDGTVLASKVMEHGVSVPRPAWAEQDAEEIYWGEFKIIARQLLAEARIDPKDIAGIGVSGLTPTLFPLTGRERHPALYHLHGQAGCGRVPVDHGEVRGQGLRNLRQHC